MAELSNEVWHQQLGHTTMEQMATITAMAAQVKHDAERVAHNTANIQLCMESTLPAVKKDLEQQ